MQEYIGKICPFCKTEIKEGDAVKVCPECGIPHHEACWEENKGCTTFGCSQQHYEEQHTNPTDVCVKCGAPLGDGQDFCPKCGMPKGGEKKRICGKCGTELQEGQDFCPKCGTKYDPNTTASDSTASAIDKFNEKVKKDNKKKKLIPIIAAAAVVVIGLVLFFALRGTPVSEVSLNKDSVSITEGESTKLVCTVTPDDAKDKTLVWKSSNESVAKVDDNGKVTAVSEGSCTISVSSNNGKTDECRITVTEAKPDLNAIYRSLGSPYYCDVASDGSYLSVDTNWLDIDDYFDSDAYDAIKSIISQLGLPQSLVAEMGETRALDGRQSADYEHISVSWSYHPDNGLEVMFKVK